MENLASSSTLSLSTSNHKLDSLLDDIYHFHLFNYLDIDEILKLRLVNKKFYSIVESYDIKELTFLEHMSCDYWFSTTRRFKLSRNFHISKCEILRNPPNYLLNLKYLKVETYFQEEHFELSDFNKFVNLQVLEINGLNREFDCLLQLANLEALSITFSHNDRNSSGCLLVDAPNLRALSFHYYTDNLDRPILSDNPVRCLDPLSVKHLRLGSVEDKIWTFSNLECLELDGYLANDSKILDDIPELNNLKILNLDYECNLKESNFYALKNLVNLKKKELKIVLGGVRTKEIDKLKEFMDNHSRLDFHFRYYDDLEDNLLTFTEMRYDDCISYFSHNQPSDLFKKFAHIQHLIIESKIENEDRLIDFINNCPDLGALTIDGKPPSQRFFDQLPAISQLSNLEIWSRSDDLDLTFIMKMLYLSNLSLKQDLLMNKNINLNNLKYLRNLVMKINRKEIEVEKIGRDKYVVMSLEMCLLSLYEPFDLSDEHITFEELVRWCDNLRNEKPENSSESDSD